MILTRLSALLVVLYCIGGTPTFSQTLTFEKTFGSPGFDAAYDILEIPDGYLIAGEVTDSAFLGTDAVLIRTDKNGALLWKKTYGQAGNDGFEDVIAANDGGFIAWGYVGGFGAPYANAWLVKVDDAGNLLWQKTVGVPDFSEHPYGKLIQMPDGYILSGIQSKPGYSQSFILRVNNQGDTLWSRFTPTADFNALAGHYVHNGLIYETGVVNLNGSLRTVDAATGTIAHSQEYVADLRHWTLDLYRTPAGDNMMYGMALNENSGLTRIDGWVQKVNPQRQVVWSKKYKVGTINDIYTSALLPDGSSVFGLIYNPFFNNPLNYTALTKIDSNGTVLWSRAFGGPKTVRLNRILPTADGGVIAVGQTGSGATRAQSDILLIKTDSLGIVESCCVANQTVQVEDLAPGPLQEPYSATPFENTAAFSFASETPARLTALDYCSNEHPEQSKTISFCPGETVTLGDSTYSQPAVVALTVPSANGGCDTLLTVTLVQKPQATFQQTIYFYSGDTVFIGGTGYTQPGTVNYMFPAMTADECDTPATYTLLLDCERSQSFLKKYIDPATDISEQVIVPSADGGVYVFGTVQLYEGPKLLKSDADGHILWVRRLDFLAPDDPYNLSMVEDSEGRLVGFGNYLDDLSLFAFRYDPATDQVLWYKHFVANQSCFANGLVEAAPGGDFLLYYHVKPFSLIYNSEIWRLDRSTGALVGGRIWRYNINVQLRAATSHNGAIYATGVFVDPVSNLHAWGIAKTDAAGAPLWAKVATAVPPGLEGVDIAVDAEGRIVALGKAPGSIWVQKTTIDGDLLWLRRYTAPDSVFAGLLSGSLTVQADGYVVTGFGNGGGTTSMLFLKINPDGDLLWAKQLKHAAGHGNGHSSQTITARGDDLFFIADYSPGALSGNGLWFGKADKNGQVGAGCTGFMDAAVQVQAEQASQSPFALIRTQPNRSPDNVPRTGTTAEASPFFTVCAACKPSCTDVEISQTISFCPGKTVTLGGTTYSQPGVVTLTLPGPAGGCDTLATYTLVQLPQPTLNQTISFCPGKTVTLGGTTYSQPGVVTLTLPGPAGGCDTLATYTLVQLPQPTLNQTISFCPGETVTLGGTTYSQPGVVTLTLPGAAGACDTIATYVLKYQTEGQVSVLQQNCPANLTVSVPSGAGGAVVNYNLPSAQSTCTCPGIDIALQSGAASGSVFPPGVTSVCYRAEDKCGSVKTCCFTVSVEEEEVCDTKTTGCLTFELLSVRLDAGQNQVFRVRVTNNCSAELAYAYLQVPTGVPALAPANNTVYVTPGGRSYLVRNPNFSPFYSLRFKPAITGPANGQADVFRYVLPEQTDLDYLHVAARLTSEAYYETYLNTFTCPFGVEPEAAPELSPRNAPAVFNAAIDVFPNPVAAGETLGIAGEAIHDGIFEIFDPAGRIVGQCPIRDNRVAPLPSGLGTGIYLFKILDNGRVVGNGKLVVK